MRIAARLVLAVVLVLQACELNTSDPCDGDPYCEPGPIDPRCAGEGAGYCSGDVRVDCYADGTSFSHDCAGETSPRTCVQGGLGIAFCAVSAQQEERCQGEPWPGYCDAGVLTRCREGFVEEVTPCPGGACIEHEPRRNFCALSTERDPRCTDEGPSLDKRFCDGSFIIDCVDGYAARFLDCAPGYCDESGDRAFCF